MNFPKIIYFTVSESDLIKFDAGINFLSELGFLPPYGQTAVAIGGSVVHTLTMGLLVDDEAHEKNTQSLISGLTEARRRKAHKPME